MKTNFNEATQYQNSNSQNTDFPVTFFSIKPGEQAIVRILVDSDDDLCAYGYHEIETPDGKTKRVNCIRSLRDDINKCPFCAANVPFNQTIYIHLLQYFPDGHIEAKTWGRKPPIGSKGTSVIDKIRKALNDYGPLSNYVSAITRTGTGLDTSYSININLPEMTYPAASFPLDKSAFENYSEEGTIIKNWTAEEMQNFLTTGQMPVVNTNSNFNPNTAQPAYQQPNYNNQSVQQYAYAAVPNGVDDTALPFNNVNNMVPADDDLPFANTPVGNPVNYGVNNATANVPPVMRTAPFAPAYQQQATVERPVRRYN